LPNPLLEYTSILRKINDIYSQYLPKSNYDLLDVINHYESKKPTKNILKQVEDRTKQEWEGVIISLCDELIKRLSKNKNTQKIYSKELDKAKKIKIGVKEDKLNLEDYDKIFTRDLLDLRRNVDSKLLKEKIEWNRFLWGLGLGLLLGIIAGVISTLLIKGLI